MKYGMWSCSIMGGLMGLGLIAGCGGRHDAASAAQDQSAVGADGGCWGHVDDAIAACKDLKVDDACRFAVADKTIEGTCQTETDPSGSPLLFCVPKPPTPPVPSEPPVFGCENLKEGDACKYPFNRKSFEGTCQMTTDPTGSPLLFCVPNPTTV